MCIHSNRSRPYTNRFPNPQAGQPVLDSEGNLIVKHDMVLCQDEEITESYVRCNGCGKKADYDMTTFQVVSGWYSEEYVHQSSTPVEELAFA